MKKIIALLLALVMVFALAACGTSEAPAEEPATKAEEPAKTAEEPAKTAEEPAEAPAADLDMTVVATVDEDVDYSAREPYKIVYAHYDNNLLEQQMWDAFSDVADKYNVELDRMTGDTDDEQYVTNLQAIVDRGDVDAIVIETTNSVQNAVLDIMAESGIPYVNLFTEYYDENGVVITPTVGLPQYQVGYDSLEYLCKNYKEFWGDVDTSKIGLIGIDFSVSPALNARVVGAEDCFKAYFPGNENIFYSDSFAAGASAWFTLEGGYDPTAQTIASHPEIEYWMVDSCLENYSQGAARAADDLDKNDTMLITTVGSPMLTEEWDNGYDGAWKCCVAISNYAYATPAILSLVAMLDGRATAETIWPQYLADGDQCAIWLSDYAVVTKDTYKQYMADIDAKYGP